MSINTTSYVIGSETSSANSVVGSSMVTNENMRTVSTELGQDAFMQILIAQLANQDPTQPMSDTDFIAQMAQFSALEQMQALNATFQSSQVYNYVGKTVVATTNVQDPATQEWVTTELQGEVTGIKFINDKPYLIVGEYYLDPASVSQVLGSGSGSGNGGFGSSLENSILQSGALVGKFVTANVTGENGGTEEVSGEVERVVVKNGIVYARINGKEVPISSITAIDDEPIEASQIGTAQNTGKPFDFYIEGNGYFVTRDDGGNEYYTRDGRFAVDNNGIFRTEDGRSVLGYPVAWNATVLGDEDTETVYGSFVKANVTTTANDLFDLKVDTDMYHDYRIDETGALKAKLREDTIESNIHKSGSSDVTIPRDTEITLGYVALADFSNASKLESIGSNSYVTTVGSGLAQLGDPGDEGYGTLLANHREVFA